MADLIIRNARITTLDPGQPLASAIADYLEIPLTQANVRRFADEEIFVEILENVRGEDVFVIPLEGIVDIAAEKARLEKALAASQKEAKSLEGRLSNPAFAEKAKPEAVEKARADLAHHSGEVERLTAALARLG